MDNVSDQPAVPGPRPEMLLLQQKRELAILNAIFQIISNTNNLQETLEKALDFVLTYINSSVGWVCLLDDDGGCSAFVGHKGLCFASADGSPAPCLVRCVCDRVRKTREVVIIGKLTQGCPLLSLQGESERLVTGHVSIPLTTKSRIVGQLNIAFDDPVKIIEFDIELLKTIGPQLAVAIENARLWEELQYKEKVRTELLKKVVTAQEEERRRISRELHDEMGQSLTSLLIGLKVLEKTDPNAQAELVIGSMEKTVAQLLSSIHDLALELRPTALDDLGLVPALEQYIKEYPARFGINVDYEVVGMNGHRLPRDVETSLYRIIQESLTNVARHAQALKASVILKMGENSVIAIIEDDGMGFDPRWEKQGNLKPNRLGLFGMEERAALIGGTLTVESSPGSGTSIFVEIPFDRSQPV